MFKLFLFSTLLSLLCNQPLKAMHGKNENDDSKLNYLNLSQKNISHAIIAYLKSELASSTTQPEIANIKSAIHWFEKSAGECIGYSILWAYGHRLQDAENENSSERDDLSFFKKMIQKLASWDEKSKFSSAEKKDLDRFINNIRYYQMPSESFFIESKDRHFDLSLTLEDTKRGSPICNFRLNNIPLTGPLLINRLKKIIKPGAMIFLGAANRNFSTGHIMAAYKSIINNKIYFYDPNNNSGEISVDTIEDLVKAYWESSKVVAESTFFYDFNKINMVSIIIFSFKEDIKEEYPPIEAIELLSFEEKIEMIALSGSLEKVRFDFNGYLRHVLDKLSNEELEKIINWENIKFNEENSEEESSTKEEILTYIILFILKNKSSISLGLTHAISAHKKIIESLKIDDINDQEKIRALLGNKLTKALKLLIEKPGDNKFIEKTLERIDPIEAKKENGQSLGRNLILAVARNIENNSINSAFLILKILMEKFNMGLTTQQIVGMKNGMLNNFICENLIDYYYDKFGNKPLFCY